MAEKHDIVIQRARLRGRPDDLFEIGISGGKVVAIEQQAGGAAAGTWQGEVEIDARGNLVTESFTNTHLHLCKVYTLQMMDEDALRDYHGADMGKAMTAIELAARLS